MQKEGKVISPRAIKIDKAQTTTLAIIGIAAFVAIFSLVTSKTLIGQLAYQHKVESAQQKSLDQFNNNNQAATKLINSYKSFSSKATNILGGTISGSASQDGNNAKIILDALPTQYDFPALATSIEKLISQPGITIDGISGTDTGATADPSVAGAVIPVSGSAAVAIPFQFTIAGAYNDDQLVINQLLNSIRPISIHSISLSGSDSSLDMQISAQTYYQPSAGLVITPEVEK